MKNIIDYDSLSVHPRALDKFIESDAPGTLSWLNLEANDLDIDIPPFRGVELNSVVPPCTATEKNRQVIPCQLRCVWRRNQRIEACDEMELRDISNPETINEKKYYEKR